MIELDTDHDIAKAAAIKVELREYKATCLTRAAKCRREAETAFNADMPEWINAARRFEAERSGPQREPPYPAKPGLFNAD